MNAYKTEFLSLLDDAICAFKQEQLASPFCFGNNEDINFFNLKTAVGPCKKVQDFDHKPIDARVEHPQEVAESIQTKRAKSSITEETGRLRDRSEKNFTVIEEKNGSNLEDFFAADISVHLFKEKKHNREMNRFSPREL